METSTASTYLGSLNKARKYTPDVSLSKELTLKLAQRGLCIAPNTTGWMKVTCPTVKSVFQMELGKPGDENTLIVTVLNDKIPNDEIFPLYSVDYDQIILPLISPHYSLDDVVNEIVAFIVEHEPDAGTLLSASVPARRSTKR